VGGDSSSRSGSLPDSSVIPNLYEEIGDGHMSVSSSHGMTPTQAPLALKLHEVASKLPTIPSRVIEGRHHRFRPQKMAPDEVALLGEVVKALDSIVTQNVPLTASLSLDLLRIVQAFPEQICQWSILHAVEPRTRSAQLWSLGVLQALARLQHPRTAEAWQAFKESDIQLSIGTYVELCHYFGLPSDPSDISAGSESAVARLKTERAVNLQSVLQHAKATGNSIIILTCWNHTIQALLAQGDIVGAEREWHALLRLNVPPQIELLQSFIRYYSKHVRRNPQYAEKVASLHARIKLLNVSPDLQTYAEILKCYERSMHYREMDAVLLEMTQEELKLHGNPQSIASTGQVSVKGPRATLVRESDFEPTLHWHASPSRPFGSPSKTPLWGESGHSESEPTLFHSPSSTTESPGAFSRSTPSSDFSYAIEDNEMVESTSSSIAAVKAAAQTLAQSSSAQTTSVKVGQLVYTGGAQWVGGGRKQPTKAKSIRKLESQLLDPVADLAESRPLKVESVNKEDLETIRKRKGENLMERKAKIVLSWSRVIYHALSLGSLRKAMYLVEQMELLGLQVNDRICTEFMYYAGKHHNLPLLRAWWRRLCQIPGYTLLRKHYLILMRELLRIDEAKEARKVMTDLCASFGHSDDAYALWLRYYAKKGLFTSVENTLKQMDVHQVEYGLYSTSALVELFAKRGNAQEMLIWLERLKAKSKMNHRTIDDVVSKCIYHYLNEKHVIEDVKLWLDVLPGSPNQYPRILGALLTTLGSQGNFFALDYVASLCNGPSSTHVLVGLIRGYSKLPSSPKRDHTVMEVIQSCGNVKYQLSKAQIEDILAAFIDLEMPTVLLDWQEDLISHPHHVTEPSSQMFKLAAQASLVVGAPERFVTITSKCFGKYAIAPSVAVTSSVIRAVCATKDVNRILYVASPLTELYSYDPTKVLVALDEELTLVGIKRPANVPAPAGLANPSTLDIPAYIAKRLHLSAA
jgi:hypothetical protein